MTEVINIRNGDKFDAYIGRAGHNQDGYYGNPHIIGYCPLCRRTHDREDSLKEYKIYFYKRLEEDEVFKIGVKLLKDNTLGCFCKPLPCHGDIIKEYLDNLKD